MIRTPWLAPVAWAVVILSGTSIPGRNLPDAFPYADKLVHLALYGILGGLVARALSVRAAGLARSRPLATGWIAAAVAGIALFAAADEFHQEWIPGRSGDRLDWVADVAGASAGLVLAASARRPVPQP